MASASDAEREAQFTEYGNERAREARKAQLEEGYCMVCGVYHRVGGCAAIEKAARDARTAALLEAAQQALDQTSDDPPPGDWNAACWHIRDVIRHLADTPPQSEEHHLTLSEQKVMHHALRRSLRPVDPPQSEGGEG